MGTSAPELFSVLFFISFSLIPTRNSPSPPPNMLKRGQAVLDYDAKNRQELSLMAHEVLNIYELSPLWKRTLCLGRGGIGWARSPGPTFESSADPLAKQKSNASRIKPRQG